MDLRMQLAVIRQPCRKTPGNGSSSVGHQKCAIFSVTRTFTKWLLLVNVKSNVAFRFILVIIFNCKMTKLQSNVVQS